MSSLHYPNIVGREIELKSFEQAYEIFPLQIFLGIPGIGKSFLLQEIYKQKEKQNPYGKYKYCKLSQPVSFSAFINSFFKDKSSTLKTPEQFVKFINQQSFFLVVDNIDLLDTEELNILLAAARKFLKKGHILLSATYLPEMITGGFVDFKIHQLSPLSSEESFKILNSFFKKNQQPLPLSADSESLYKTCCGIPSYIKIYADSLLNHATLHSLESISDKVFEEIDKFFEKKFNSLPLNFLKKWIALGKDCSLPLLIDYTQPEKNTPSHCLINWLNSKEEFDPLRNLLFLYAQKKLKTLELEEAKKAATFLLNHPNKHLEAIYCMKHLVSCFPELSPEWSKIVFKNRNFIIFEESQESSWIKTLENTPVLESFKLEKLSLLSILYFKDRNKEKALSLLKQIPEGDT